jgi:RNA ligase
VSGRPLHKFFNVNERDETKIENLDWSKVVRVMDKRDGSMIHSVMTADGVKLKSKKTFTSDVALAATAWMNANPMVRSMVEKMASQNCTAIFEWTAPDARIVLFYPDAGLQLLHVRNNETGRYMDGDVMKAYADVFGVKCVDEPKFDVPMENLGEHLLELAKTVEGIEGWVIQFANDEMVKLKTAWYMNLHRAMVFVRERDIAKLVLDETLDDIKSKLVNEGVNIQEIIDIEAKVLQQIRMMTAEVEYAVSQTASDMSRKDFAIKHNGNRYFGLMMKQFSGQEPDYLGYFEKNMLKENFGLRQLVMVPSIAEGD